MRSIFRSLGVVRSCQVRLGDEGAAMRVSGSGNILLGGEQDTGSLLLGPVVGMCTLDLRVKTVGARRLSVASDLEMMCIMRELGVTREARCS